MTDMALFAEQQVRADLARLLLAEDQRAIGTPFVG